MSGQRFVYDSERQRHEKFVGRAELIARLDGLLVDPGADCWVVVTGGPGMGKSAILTTWLARREAAGAAVPHHFIRRGAYNWDDPSQLVSSLVAQLEERFELHEPEADERLHPAARLHRMLSRVSSHQLAPRNERLVVVIDGLDEYDPPATAAGDPLAAFLPHALPAGVSVLCASRPRHPYLARLATRDGKLVQIDLDDPASAADNEATVRAFWDHEAGPLGFDPRVPDDARFLDEAVARADGNLEHAVQLRKQLEGLSEEQLRAARDRIEDIPRGLAELIAMSWERVAVEPIVEAGLGLLCAAREALSLDELAAVAGWSSNAPRLAFLRGARELLVETSRPDGTSEFRLHHDSIRAHVAKEIGSVALSQHHRSLAERLARWPCAPEATSRQYALRHALIHRVDAGNWIDAWRVAGDLRFLEAKCRELGVHETEADVARLAERCRASRDDVLGQRAGDLARALARESHWLRDAPEATAALVWNRLRRFGWSADELDGQLRVPDGGSFLRVRHAHTRESPALVRDLEGHTRGVMSCAVTPDGRQVVSASPDKTLKIWDLDSGRAIATLEGHTGGVIACAVTPNGRHVVSASVDQTLKVWELATGRALSTLEGHTSTVTACAVTPDGRHVVSASGDNTLKVWELATGRALATLEGHTRAVTACAVTPDGQHVVSASVDQTLKVWELATGRALATLEGHTWHLHACAVTPDGRHVVSASGDNTLKVWELATGRALVTLEGHTNWVMACAVTPNGRHVVSASVDQTLKVWELATGRALANLQGHTDWVMAYAVVTPDGRHVVSASVDQTLKVWELATGRALATLEGHISGVTACAVAPDDRHVVSASLNRTLKVWELATGRALSTLKGHTEMVTACVVTPNGQHVVSASHDGTLKVWELATERALATLEGHTHWVTACAVTPDGRHVVSASHDQTLKVWELATGRTLTTLKSHTDVVTACAVTPDGRHVVSASDDQTLKVWELASGRALATLEGHTSGVTACAVTPDGRHVVSASHDNTLKVWELDTFVCRLTHRGDAPYNAVAATATVIVAGDRVGGVWFLDMPPSYRSAEPSSIHEGMHRVLAASPPEATPAISTPDAATSRDPEQMELPVMKNPDVREGAEFPATVVFVVIKGLKDCSDAPQIPNALRALNEALRDVDAGAFVLSTIAGVIVVVPDTVAWSADDLFKVLDQAKVGLALKVGVTHGTVEVVKDIDDEPNLIGPPINIAARLATSSDNSGLLVHESYAEFVDATLPASHWLHRSMRKAIQIAGKPQDPKFACFPGPHAFDAKLPAPQEPYSSRPAVLIAYDLPKFSAGDRAQLRQRFTRLVDVFQQLRQSASMQTAIALLSPGGDGGVLVLEGMNLADATAVAERLQRLTKIASLDHADTIAVETRIGVHYGSVVHYVNARGISRPTGLTVFVADEIASDDHARSRKGIIFTRLLADSFTAGSSQRLASEFEVLPRITAGPASGLERFVRADSMRAERERRAASSQQDREFRTTRDDLLTHTRSFAHVVGAPEPPAGTLEIQLPEPLAGIGRPASSRIRELMQTYREAPFAGRDREAAALHTWLSAPGAPLGLLAAAAGRGKSALLLRWSAEVVAAGNTDLLYIPISIRFDTAHVAPVAKAIAGRLRHLMRGKQPIPIDDPFAALDECKDLLGTDWLGHRPLLVILDGLDEAIGWKPSELIPSTVGRRIKLLVATRGAEAHWIEQLSWTSPRSFELEALDRPAVQAVVASVPELQVVAGDDVAMERFQILTGGDPLVVQLHLRLVKHDNDGAAEQRFHRLLQGDLSDGEPLKRFFDRWWVDQQDQWKGQGAALNKTVECVLALLACAKGPLRLADLCALEDWEPEAVREALAQLSRLVIVDPAGDRYVFGHSRLHDYFVERLREAGKLDSWKQRYLDYGAARFKELSAELPVDAEDFTRRFGYVLYYYALHLQDDAPDRLIELMSWRWLEGWRRLEAEDGVYGGFYESVSRAEYHARTSHMLGEQTQALLIKTSVTSLSSNVPPQLMRRLIETRLWPLSRALRVIDRMVDDNERALALGLLAGGVEATGQGKILARAMNLSKGYRTRALAWMMPDLADMHRQAAFEAILIDGALFDWRSLVNLNRFVEALSQDFAQRLLAAARTVAEPERRLRALIEITESAGSLPIEDRIALLRECEHLVAEIESAEHRVYYRQGIASAATACAPEARPRLLRATLDEIRALGIGDRAVISTLEKIADGADAMDPATRADAIAALWSAVHTSDVPWLALSSLGPRLGRLGFVSQVLERSGSITHDEHSRSLLLASLLPHAGDHLDRVWQSLWQLKRRDWVLQAVAPYIPQLSDEHRTAHLDESLDLVSRDPERSDLLSPIARWMVAGDRDAPRLLAAVRALPDSSSRAWRLADCAHLVSDEKRDGLVREILQDARNIALREYKRRLLRQLVGIIRGDQTLLLSTLAASRQISDERMLVHAVERIAVTLGENGEGQAAVALAARAAGTFARYPGWVLEAHVSVITVLPEGDDKTALWNTAVDAAGRLPSASGRAYFLAALTPIAPAPVKIEHTLAAWAAIQRLELPFERAYTAVRLLKALDDDSRKDKLEWVIAQLSQDMSRWERLQVICDLMSRLDDAELAMYRPTLDGSIDRVLQYTPVSDDEPREREKDEIDPRDHGIYLDELAKFLDLGRVRKLVARCPVEAVSTLELLALRVAELGQRDEALDLIRRLESSDSRARALARVLAHLPAATRAAILAEVCQNLEESRDRSQKAEVEALLVEHLTGAEREQRISAALQHAPLIRDESTRHDTLYRLATNAATHLAVDRLHEIWAELLRRIAVQRREALVADLIALLPIVRRLAGSQALRTLGDTLLDVAEWFP